MVIKSDFFETDENFVQPAEMGTPFDAETGLQSLFSVEKEGVWRFDSVCFSIFEYEYAKSRKLPFLSSAFGGSAQGIKRCTNERRNNF